MASYILREEHKFQMSEDGAPRKMSEPENCELKRNDELRAIRQLELLAVHVARRGTRDTYKVLRSECFLGK
jgi:hypothetical protein